MVQLSIPRFPKIFAALVLIIGLGGCSEDQIIKYKEQVSDYFGGKPVKALPDSIAIGPDVLLQMPKPADLGQTLEATQFVTAHYGNRTFTFNVRISADKTHFRAIGKDMAGRRSLGIDWTSAGAVYDSAPWFPSQLNPEYILADMSLIYWPDGVVGDDLQTGTLITGKNYRRISSYGKKIIQIDYDPFDKDIWSGRVHYENFARGYSLDIQSTRLPLKNQNANPGLTHKIAPLAR